MYHSLFARLTTLLLTLAIAGTEIVSAQSDPLMSLQDLRGKRKELAQRKRRLIMNNDGCDVLYFPKAEEATLENFLAKRTTPLAGTHVDAIAFCPTSSGFSFFTHKTKVGTVLTRSGYDYGIQPDSRNIAKDLIDGGTDCLQAVVEFGHGRDMEVFWSIC